MTTLNLKYIWIMWKPKIIEEHLCRLLSCMNKDEGSEVNHCCQVFTNILSSVTKFICHIFWINFVIMSLLLINFVSYKLCYHIKFVMYKRLNYKLCYLTHEKLAAETCQDLAILYQTSMSVLYSAHCTHTSVFRVQICVKSFVFYFACQSISTFIIFGGNPVCVCTTADKYFFSFIYWARDEVLLDQQRDVIFVFWAWCILPVRSWSPRIWRSVQYTVYSVQSTAVGGSKVFI